MPIMRSTPILNGGVANETNSICDEIFFVAVDSREKSPSDLECYKEVSCSPDFFQVHVHDDPNNIEVKCKIAELCGLEMKLYFHDHSNPGNGFQRHHDYCESPIGNANDIATLLTFNPENGRCNYLVRGKAYVLLDDGRRPLSKQQVWKLVEMIRDVKKLYDGNGMTHSSKQENRHENYKGSAVELPSSPTLLPAYLQLLTMCTQYQEGNWEPHSPFETPHHTTHHSHRGRRHHRRNENPSRDDTVGRLHTSTTKPTKDSCRCGAELRKQESGASDAATCNHGACHHHHDVTAAKRGRA